MSTYTGKKNEGAYDPACLDHYNNYNKGSKNLKLNWISFSFLGLDLFF
jgi:hypothetical protein